MNFAPAAEEKALVASLTEALTRVCSPVRVRAWEAEQVSFDDAFLAAIRQGGYLEAGLAFGDCPSFGVLVQLAEVAGRVLAPPLFSWQAAYAAFLLDAHPLARRIAAGEVLAPVVPGRSNLVLSDGRLNGSADGVPFVDKAQTLLLPLPLGEGRGEGSQIALVPTSETEVQLVTTQSLVPQWKLTFTQTEAELVPGQAGRYEQALDRLRASLAAWSTGAGGRAIDLASAYGCAREQFGHPVGSYQSVQNRLVDAAIQVEEARMLVYRAAALIDAGQPEAGSVALLARRQADKAFVQASRAALLTFGGYGFTVDFDIQLYFRRS
ncbi:MAG TPA: acyl-CoA dehydrogenase family protein, partial [Chloroflexota bacterium]